MSQKLLDLKIWRFQHHRSWGLESPNLIPVSPSRRRLTLTTWQDFVGIYMTMGNLFSRKSGFYS